jgi:hypothetical protein
VFVMLVLFEFSWLCVIWSMEYLGIGFIELL